MAQELTPEQGQLFLQHMGRFKRQKCPVCGNNNWAVGGMEAAPAYEHDGGGAMLGGPVIPAVVVVCDKCGFIRRFAWRVVTGEFRRGG